MLDQLTETVSPVPPLTPEQAARLEQRIEHEIGRLQRIAQRAARAEFQRGGDDLDVTSLRQGHEADQALRARCADSLTELIQALHRLRVDPAGFGVCGACGRPIPWERLDLLPTALTCAGC